jgi:hypothetical protein
MPDILAYIFVLLPDSLQENGGKVFLSGHRSSFTSHAIIQRCRVWTLIVSYRGYIASFE